MKLLSAALVGAGLVYVGARLMSKLYAELEFLPDDWDDWTNWTESDYGEWYGDDADDLEMP